MGVEVGMGMGVGEGVGVEVEPYKFSHLTKIFELCPIRIL